ncbi:MAG TPA: DUF364 domain-containing protein [Syntrophales bacterium]|nr:DUF364 domain-containing protein [Syntrophales bacterium]HOX94535.1 DUF364 domain-containing protein [Syntrophales bacterium]HPI58197.1 DUF364 domain-containing protein [Syntrophales bacterium]HPN26035.1 DUF364 domain-containing protein [Syntrophales bacterium]HQM30312.1 DUF364 domain-containing protein [Syntrophales bacterium]
MLPAGTITKRLVEGLRDKGNRVHIEEIVQGLCYVAVRLRQGGLGLAALRAGTEAGEKNAAMLRDLQGRKASEILDYLVSGVSLTERALGLAAANAVIHPGVPGREQDTIELMSLVPGDRVAMVGLFSPLVDRIRRTGAELNVVERDENKPGISDPGETRRVLKECSVAIITATTLLNGTIEDVLNALGRPRHVALIGPSTPACPEAFQSCGIHHLGGASIVNEREVLRVVAEGGGTPAMRPYLRFWNIRIGKGFFPPG